MENLVIYVPIILAGVAFYAFYSTWSFKYYVDSKISTIRFGKGTEFFIITTAIITRLDTPVKEKGIFVYATKALPKSFVDFMRTVPVTEQEIERTLSGIKKGDQFSLSWGHKNAIKLEVNSREVVIKFERLNGLINTKFKVEIDSTFIYQLEKAFTRLKNTETMINIEA